MATVNSLARQILLRISGGATESAASVKMPDVKLAVIQKLNYLLKSEYLNVVLEDGETIPNGLMVFTYEDVPVEVYGKKSRSVLPFMPLSLPRNIGVLEVATDINFTNLLIPVQISQNVMISSQDVLNDLIDVTYTPNGKYLDYNKDLTIQGIKSVFVKLVGSDISKMDEYDVLPIGADIEMIVVEDLVKVFLPFQQSDKVVDSYVAINSNSLNNK